MLIDPLTLKKPNTKIESNLESKFDKFGVCPNCNKKMEIATCAGKDVFLCSDDRIILPIVEEDDG